MRIWTARIALSALATFGLFLPAVAATPGGTSETAGHSLPPDVVFFDLPVVDISNSDNCPLRIPPAPGEPIEVPIDKYKIHKIVVDEDGNTLFNGTKIAVEDFDKAFKTYLVADGLTELQIQPYAQAQAKPVLRMLGSLTSTSFPCYGFVGNYNYSQIWRSKTSSAKSWPPSKLDFSNMTFDGSSIDPVVVYVVSTDINGREPGDVEFTDASADGRCRLFLGSKPVSNKELVNLVTAAMFEAVDRAGGQEKFISGEAKASDLPSGLIISSSNTPWRCVGGAIYNLQLSGFVRLGAGLIPDPQPQPKPLHASRSMRQIAHPQATFRPR